MSTIRHDLLPAALAILIAGAAAFSFSACSTSHGPDPAPTAHAEPDTQQDGAVRLDSGASPRPTEEMIEASKHDPPGGRRRRPRVPAEFREMTVPVEKGAVLRVRAFGAPVRVTGADRPDLFLRAELGATTRERLADTRIDARPSGAELIIEPVWPDDRARGEFAWFEIEAPTHVGGVIIEADTGPVELLSVHGRAEVHAARGEVRVTDQAGPVLVSTTNGAVIIERPAGDVDATTAHATIRVLDAPASVRARTTSGALVVTLTDSSRGPLDLTATDGEADVTVGESFDGTITLTSPGVEPVIFPGQGFKPTITPDWAPFPRVHRTRFGEAEVVFSDAIRTSNVRTTGATVTLRQRVGKTRN